MNVMPIKEKSVQISVMKAASNETATSPIPWLIVTQPFQNDDQHNPKPQYQESLGIGALALPVRKAGNNANKVREQLERLSNPAHVGSLLSIQRLTEPYQ